MTILRLLPFLSTVVFTLLALSVTPVRLAAELPLQPSQAKRIFDEARQLSEADGGRLWGLEMYGPMLLVDPVSRRVITNEADNHDVLLPEDGVYVGALPDSAGIANTATEWAGKYWTMLMWPLPDDELSRRRLLAHELWHRVQAKLNLRMGGSPTLHLGTRDGRIWMQLEWRALATALRAEDELAQKNAIVDALAFRSHRRSLFPGSAASERSLEMNEGLAEYTGFALCGQPPQQSNLAIAAHLDQAENKPTFVRAFAYASGPAYGALLDSFDSSWRQGLSLQDDLGSLLSRHIVPISAAELTDHVKSAAQKYNGNALMAAEDALELERQKRVADYRRRFVDGPVLQLDFVRMGVSFDPNGIDALEDLGSVYRSCEVKDEWGVLNVTGGALIAKDWRSIVVPAPGNLEGRPLQGEGYTLELADGWKLVALKDRPGFSVQPAD